MTQTVASGPPPSFLEHPERPAPPRAVPVRSPRPARGSEPPPPTPVERPTPEPTRRLARGARAMWTLQAAGSAVASLLITALITRLLVQGDVIAPAWRTVALGAVLVFAVVNVAVVPQLRWRRWRYEVRESEIDLRRGAFTVRRTLVPMSRVQHVDTRRTALSQAFGLAAVVFHTAAGANEIPALTEAEAGAIRDQIADLASSVDDET